MKNRIILLSISIYFITFAHSAALACTGFFAYRNDLALAGKNDDWVHSHAFLEFIPKRKGKYGTVYLKVSQSDYQSGINDQGLFFGFFLAPNLWVKKSLDKPKYNGFLVKKAMEECATVNEVLTLIDKYNLEVMARFQALVSDKSGDSAIIEGDIVHRKSDGFQVVTNFYLSQTDKPMHQCSRYNTAYKMLKTAKNHSIESFRQILYATHVKDSWFNGRQISNTVDSTIYDLTNGNIHIYYQRDFGKVVILNVKNELKKGYHIYNLKTLFENLKTKSG